MFQMSAKPDRWYIEAREGAKYDVTVHRTRAASDSRS